MTVVQIRDGRTSYSLTAALTAAGDLVLSGHDLSSYLAEHMDRDEYEYFYAVKSHAVPQLCVLLGTSTPGVLEAVRALLAPHGINASKQWRLWLESQGVAFDFTVR